MNRPSTNLLDWKGAGYLGFPFPRSGARLSDEYLWKDFERILEQAKKGDFTSIPELVDLFDSTESWILSAAYIALLGDVGTPAAFEKVLPIVQARIEPTYQVYLSESLAFWGKLSVIPSIVVGWQDLEGFQDAEDIPPVLSMMLEEIPGPIDSTPNHACKIEYGELVMARYEELKEKFGTDDIIVFRGDRFGVRRLAQIALADLSAGRFEPFMRRRFEATTGINCTRFYKDGELQSLAAASIVEEFLESSDSYKYIDGVRYFFGHQIPD
jgi:hypothetical protein